MSSDDDELEFDLSAFEAPEPPGGIADAVLARLDGTAVTPAVPAEPRDGKRRGYLIAGVAVVVLAASAGTYALIQGSRRAGPMRGDVVAVRARSLSLDGVSAELDTGAQVKWQRRGQLLDVEQREGSAAWRVDRDMTLRIDAGAMVASVEATGASLRVEVSMNATDVRVLGASALTAAAVSMVTVTVYTGHVKVSERGQTVVVMPGETHTVAPPQPAPQQPEPVVAGMPAESTAGAPAGDTLDRAAISEGIDKVKPRIRACGNDIVTQGKVIIDVTVLPDGSVGSATATQTFSQPVAACVVGIILGATFRATTQGGSFSYPFTFTNEVSTVVASGGTGLSREDISKTIAGAKSAIAACGTRSAAGGKVIVTAKVRPDGKVGSFSTKETYDAKVSGCVLDIVKKLAFPATHDGGSFSYPFVFDSPACDADALKDKGMEHINMGQHAAALAMFEASLRCEQDAYVLQLAFMSACSSRNQVKARQYYQQLTPGQQTKFVVLCTRNGVDPTPPAATSNDVGFLQVLSKPEGGKVLVDGVDTKRVTPVMGSALELKPGRHKITIVLGADRYTWPVVIEAGAIVTLDKVLE